MVVIFFKTDVVSAQELLRQNSKAVAFWFAPGLMAYQNLDEVIEISSLYIEDSIFASFCDCYPEFTKKISTQRFSSAPNIHPAHFDNKILFLASSDTITKSFKPIIDELWEYSYELLCKPNENAKKAADALNLPSKNIHLTVGDVQRFSLLVLGNDWGPTERKINSDFLLKKVNTICIQESSIDFNKKDNRMRFCSFPVFQGIATLQNFDFNGLMCAIIGNPRFEQLELTPPPQSPRALINVNFTYGIYEEVREKWLEDILSACEDVSLDYVISQHPRDTGDLKDLKVLRSNAGLVHDSIRESSVVISRFSALLTESVCLGRPCIYYNPHNEIIHYRFDPDNKMFFVARNKAELRSSLEIILNRQHEAVKPDYKFISKHLGVTYRKEASKYIVKLFADVAKFPPIKKYSAVDHIKSYLLIAKRKLRNQRY